MRFEPNYRGMRNYLTGSPELRRVLRDRAELGAQHARSIAPVDTGEYVAGIGVEDGPIVGDGRFAPRQTVHLVAKADHSAAVEFGSRNVPAQHILAQCIDVIERG